MAEIRGYLTLIGDAFNPDDVTAQLKVSPDWVRAKNEVLGNGREFGHYEWGIDTDYVEGYDLAPIVSQLLKFIQTHTQVLAEVAKKYCAEWHILFSISSTEDFPATCLSSEFVQMAAEIHAAIGFDVCVCNTVEGDGWCENIAAD